MNYKIDELDNIQNADQILESMIAIMTQDFLSFEVVETEYNSPTLRFQGFEKQLADL
jgi:hypothetical protein